MEGGGGREGKAANTFFSVMSYIVNSSSSLMVEEKYLWIEKKKKVNFMLALSGFSFAEMDII